MASYCTLSHRCGALLQSGYQKPQCKLHLYCGLPAKKTILSSPSFRKTARARTVSIKRVKHTVPVHTKGTEVKDCDSH